MHHIPISGIGAGERAYHLPHLTVSATLQRLWGSLGKIVKCVILHHLLCAKRKDREVHAHGRLGKVNWGHYAQILNCDMEAL